MTESFSSSVIFVCVETFVLHTVDRMIGHHTVWLFVQTASSKNKQRRVITKVLCFQIDILEHNKFFIFYFKKGLKAVCSTMR